MAEKKINFRNKKFPEFEVIILVIAVIWLFNDFNFINVDIPWIPVILIIVAIGMIVNRYSKTLKMLF